MNCFNTDGSAVSDIALPDIFAVKVNGHLLYESVKCYRANQRQGTAKTKRRGEVSGGGIKPWKQKGTGRARSGSNTSSIWVRGGKAHGPNPHLYKTAFNKKARKQSLIMALASKASTGGLKLIEAFSIDEPKTKKIVAVLEKMGVLESSNLVVLDQLNKNALLAARNIKDLAVKQVKDLSAYDVLNCKQVILTKKSLDFLQKAFKS